MIRARSLSRRAMRNLLLAVLVVLSGAKGTISNAKSHAFAKSTLSVANGLRPTQREHPISEVIRAPKGGLVAQPGATFIVTLAVDIPSLGKVWHLYSITQPPGGPIRSKITVGPP